MSALGFNYNAVRDYGHVAVSATGHPRGVWYRYSFNVLRGANPPLEQMDFDSLGFDGQAIYVTARMRDFTNNLAFSGNRMLILDKAKAMAGQALSPVIVDDLQLPGMPGQ